MKTKAVRLYGKNDLRLEEFELPPIKEDEILAKVMDDSFKTGKFGLFAGTYDGAGSAVFFDNFLVLQP